MIIHSQLIQEKKEIQMEHEMKHYFTYHGVSRLNKSLTTMSKDIKFLIEIVSIHPVHPILVNMVKAIIWLGLKEKIRRFFPKVEY